MRYCPIHHTVEGIFCCALLASQHIHVDPSVALSKQFLSALGDRFMSSGGRPMDFLIMDFAVFDHKTLFTAFIIALHLMSFWLITACVFARVSHRRAFSLHRSLSYHSGAQRRRNLRPCLIKFYDEGIKLIRNLFA